MKKLLLLFVLLLMPLLLSAQTSVMTATITDSDVQTWNNGTYTITFVPIQGVTSYQWNGATLDTAHQTFTGTMDSGGAFTASIPDSSTISPSGTRWRFTLCSNTSAPCSVVVTAVSGATPDLSSTLSAGVTAPRVSGGSGAHAYSDTEMNTPTTTGLTYYNVTSANILVWNGSAWVPIAKGTIAGTTNFVAKFTTPNNVGNSSIFDAGLGVTVASPTGGAEGAGTLNATNLYVNGVPVNTGSTAITTIQPQNNGVNYNSPLTGAIVMNFANCTVSATFTITCPTGPISITNPGHNFLTTYTSGTGLFTQAQPACTDLSDGATGCSTIAPANTTATTHQFFTAYTQSTGVFTKVQPACADLSDSGSGCSSTVALTFKLSGTSAMGTSAISANTCATVVSTTATGVLTTDSIIVSANTNPTVITGYGPATSEGLYIDDYPTADHVNFVVCNNTGNSITPSALTLNWSVIR